MLTEKERLEEELKLLEESLDLKVITEDEYETAKARVDAKLKELDASEEKKEVEENEIKEEPEDKKEEQKIEIKELKEEDIEQPGKEEFKEEVKELIKKEEEQEEPKKEELTEEEQKIEDTQKSEISGTTDSGFPTSKSKDFEEKDTITLDFSWLKNIFRKKEPVTEEKTEEQKTLDEVKEAEDEPKETITEEKLGEVKEEKDEVKAEEIKPEEVKPIEEEKGEEVKVTEEKLAEEIKKEEAKDIEEEKVKEEIKVEEKKPEETKAEEEKPIEEVKEEEPIKVVDEEIKTSEKNKFFSSIKSISYFLYNKKLFTYVAIILILVVGSWYFYYSGSNDIIIQDTPIDIPTGNTVKMIACSSDDECKKEGSIGICNNPGQEDAECEYIQDVEIKLTILNSDDCFNCGTARVLAILKSFYPNINVENIDFESEQGKEIKEKFLITALPAYIFNSSFKEAYNYDKFSSSFNEARGSFVMKNTVANSNYYLEREEIPNKLDLFLKPGEASSSKAEENLKEFLETFDGNVNFEKHDEGSDIVEELGINTFPAFLINNKIKFGGVQSADKIRENFCQLNSITPCVLGLSKSLV